MRNRVLVVLGVSLVFGIILRFLGVGMTKSDIHVSVAGEPLACIGGVRTGEFCSPGTVIPVTNALVMTVLVDVLLVLVIIFGARNLQLIPRGFQNLVELVVEGLYNFALGIDRRNIGKFFALPATIFLFFLVANFTALIPGIGSIGNCVAKEHAAATATEGTQAAPATEGAAAPAESPGAAAAEEGPSSTFAALPGYCPGGHFVIPWLRAPAADLNVTFAVALVAVFMVEYFGFQALGLSYLTKFFNFREGPLGVFVGLIELVSEVARIIAFAFRIFGNIFGGEVILIVMSFLFPYLLPLPFYAYEVFVAFIQAVIFSLLTLIFMSNAVVAHGGHDEHGHEAPPVALEADVRQSPVH